MRHRKKIIKTKTYQFIAISDGRKRTFTNEDGLQEYPGNVIRDPKRMSYTNLYINGVLQPKKNYRIRPGVLRLNTVDAPPKGAPVLLQFIKMYLYPVPGRKRARRKRTLPTCESGEE